MAQLAQGQQRNEAHDGGCAEAHRREANVAHNRSPNQREHDAKHAGIGDVIKLRVVRVRHVVARGGQKNVTSRAGESSERIAD